MFENVDMSMSSSLEMEGDENLVNSYEDPSYLSAEMQKKTANLKPQIKKKKKRRLLSSLSCATLSDIYTVHYDDVLGEGSYGRVLSCVNNFTGREYAVKIISKNSWYYSRQKVLKEVELYYLCQGQPEIIQLIEYFEEEAFFYLIFEKAYGGQLLDRVQESKFDEDTAKKIIRDLAAALKFLHDKGIAHRDIKPENILCLNENHPVPVKLCDFDLCSSVHTSVKTPRLASPVGSAEYMAPEVVNAFCHKDDYNEVTYDKRCDLWSLGSMAYILLCGYMPFSGHCSDPDCGWDAGGECPECQFKLFNSIQNGCLVFPSREWSAISETAKDLISKLLQKNPDDRLSPAEILRHPWICNEANSVVPIANNYFYKKTLSSQNPIATKIRQTKQMKRQTSMIFPQDFDYKSHRDLLLL